MYLYFWVIIGKDMYTVYHFPPQHSGIEIKELYVIV